MPRKEYDYIITNVGKKVFVAQRRVGSRERFATFCECGNEDLAVKIVDALNKHQGDIVKIETTTTRTLEQVRQDLTKERARHADTSVKLRNAENNVRELERKLKPLEAQNRAISAANTAALMRG